MRGWVGLTAPSDSNAAELDDTKLDDTPPSHLLGRPVHTRMDEFKPAENREVGGSTPPLATGNTHRRRFRRGRHGVSSVAIASMEISSPRGRRTLAGADLAGSGMCRAYTALIMATSPTCA